MRGIIVVTAEFPEDADQPGVREAHAIQPHEFLLIPGTEMDIDSCIIHRNGTVQLVLKPKGATQALAELRREDISA